MKLYFLLNISTVLIRNRKLKKETILLCLVRTKDYFEKTAGFHIPVPKTFKKYLRPEIKIQIPEFIHVMGHKIYLAQNSLLSKQLVRYGIHEENETNLVKSKIKEGEIVVDIGANIGYYTLIFAKLVGTSGKVFAIEPEPHNFQLLQKNLKANSYQNVTIEKKVISDKNGKMKFYISESNVGEHSIFPLTRDHKSFIDVETETLDDYFHKKGIDKKISFVKIDVEGAEVAVLRGMSCILANENLKILIEYSPNFYRRFGEKSEDLFKILIKNSFQIYSIQSGDNLIEPISLSRLKKNDFNKQINLFCTKLNRKKELNHMNKWNIPW